MADAKPVRIAGLTALRRDLRRAGDLDALAGIKDGLYRGAELVAGEAAARAGSSGRPVDAALGRTYRPSRSGAKAAVRAGDNKRAELIGQEFGADRDATRSVSSHNSRSWHTRTRVTGWRQFPTRVRGGRFLYPAAAAKAGEIVDLLADTVEAVLNSSTDDGA